MNLADLRNELLLLRFSEQQPAQITNWINQAYGELWDAGGWTWKLATASLTATGGVPQLSGTPAEGFISRGLWDDSGTRIQYASPQDYFDCYLGSNSTGVVDVYTIVNNQILVGPPPATSATWTMYYEKRRTTMVNDTDEPQFPEAYHYTLVPGASRYGQALISDFTYQMVETQWQQAIASMRRSFQADVRDEPTVWPASMDELEEAY